MRGFVGACVMALVVMAGLIVIPMAVMIVGDVHASSSRECPSPDPSIRLIGRCERDAQN